MSPMECMAVGSSDLKGGMSDLTATDVASQDDRHCTLRVLTLTGIGGSAIVDALNYAKF